jgi:hypothetical protein
MSPNGWRWSVKRDHNDKVGTARDRDGAIRLAKRFIDELIKTRTRSGEQGNSEQGSEQGDAI